MIGEEKLKAAKAKVDALRAARAGLPPPADQPVALPLVYKGHDVSIMVQPEYRALVVAMPLVTMLFGKKKDPAVDARDLHKALGVGRDYSSWLKGALERFPMVEGVDFATVRIDPTDQSNWQAIKENAGKVPTITYFTPRMAARIATMTKGEVGDMVFNYMYAITDAASDAVVKRYKEGAQAAERKFLEADAIATQAAISAGYRSGTHALLAFNDNERSKRHQRAEKAATGAALIMWEQSTTARRHALAGHLPQALEALNEVEQTFGSYTDMARGTPPWSDEQ